MLAKLGCTYVAVGHSERRQYHAENDALVNAKVKAALANDLTPILCVGEGLDIREAGNHVAHCNAQLDGGLDGLTAEQVRKTVIAYEPVWAIGTGKTATPEDAQEVCGALRARLAETFGQETADSVRVLYGGSVKGSNAAALMAQPDVDGGLVGGAALDAEDFATICRFPEHIAR
jgi:triosephosphate isomerase